MVFALDFRLTKPHANYKAYKTENNDLLSYAKIAMMILIDLEGPLLRPLQFLSSELEE